MSDIDVCGSASTQQQRQPHPALLSYLYVLLMGYRPRLLLFPHPKKLETNFLLLLLLYDKQECQLSSSSSPRDGSRLSSATACAETTSCSPPLCISPFLFSRLMTFSWFFATTSYFRMCGNCSSR